MKFINLTNTIILLYDNEKMYGSISPNGISVDIPDDVAKSSPTILKFLEKGLIKVYTGKIPKAEDNTQKVVKESVDSNNPSIERFVDEVGVSSKNISNEPYVENQSKTIKPNIESVDYTPGIDEEDQGSIIVESNDFFGAKEEKVTKIIKETMEKTQETIDNIGKELNKNEEIKKAKKIEAEKIAKAPEDIKKFLNQRFLAKKWAILKSNDKEWLKKIASYDKSVEKLIKQRLEELK